MWGHSAGHREAQQLLAGSEVVAGGLSRSLGGSVAAKPASGTMLEEGLCFKRGVSSGLVYLWQLKIL